jgi:hypothetical protein
MYPDYIAGQAVDEDAKAMTSNYWYEVCTPR